MRDQSLTRWGLGGVVCLGILSAQLFSHDDNVPKQILTKKNPVAAGDSVIKKAKTSYEDNCSACHGPNGKGDGPMASTLDPKPADLSDRKMIGEMTDGEIYWQITKGKESMPAFETILSETERWGLVHLVRKLSNSQPNTTPRPTHTP